MNLDTGRMAQNIEIWPIDRLIPFDRNPKLHPEDQINRIAASIIEFGFNVPILVDSVRGIIAGHGRLRAARRLGFTAVPVIQLIHLSQTQAKAFLLAENKLGETGWDNDALEDLILELDDDGFDLSLTGFSGFELDGLLGSDLTPPPIQAAPAQATELNIPQPSTPTQQPSSVGPEPAPEVLKDESDTSATIGEYRFPIERDQYLIWIENLRQSVGFDKKSIIAEIIRRLEL